MLVLRMAVEMSCRRLQNVRRRYASGWNAPTIILLKQCRFGLGAGKAELTGVARQSPGGMIFTQRSQALGEFGFVEPFDFILLATAYGIEAFRGHKLDGACAIFADM